MVDLFGVRLLFASLVVQVRSLAHVCVCLRSCLRVCVSACLRVLACLRPCVLASLLRHIVFARSLFFVFVCACACACAMLFHHSFVNHLQ